MNIEKDTREDYDEIGTQLINEYKGGGGGRAEDGRGLDHLRHEGGSPLCLAV